MGTRISPRILEFRGNLDCDSRFNRVSPIIQDKCSSRLHLGRHERCRTRTTIPSPPPPRDRLRVPDCWAKSVQKPGVRFVAWLNLENSPAIQRIIRNKSFDRKKFRLPLWIRTSSRLRSGEQKREHQQEQADTKKAGCSLALRGLPEIDTNHPHRGEVIRGRLNSFDFRPGWRRISLDDVQNRPN